MAIYHLNVKTGTRLGGQSARAKSDYIGREGKYEKDGEELEYKESGNMPEWAEDDPRGYWAGADAHERANGRLYRQVEFALPRELNDRERVEVASSFAKNLTGEERLPYTLAVHRGGEDGGNPHAHLMFSERTNDGIERSAEQWFKRYNAQEPEKGERGKARPRSLGSGLRTPGSNGPIRQTRRWIGRDGRSGLTKRVLKRSTLKQRKTETNANGAAAKS